MEIPQKKRMMTWHTVLSVSGTPFTLIPLVAACDRESPPKPVGTATNKHVEESPVRPPKETAEALPG
jgi:hypothetical protein